MDYALRESYSRNTYRSLGNYRLWSCVQFRAHDKFFHPWLQSCGAASVSQRIHMYTFEMPENP